MTCQWCGDRHGTDQLCQRAQRGMGRRSFCFLFGAGIAGAVVAPSLSFAAETVTRIRPDASMKIVDRAYYPTVATFKSRDLRLRLGQSITVDFQGQTFFSGRIAKTMSDVDGVEYTALEHVAFEQNRPPRAGPFSELIVDVEGNPIR